MTAPLLPLWAGLDLGIYSWKGIDELPLGEGPVDHHRFAYKVIFRHKPPVTRVITGRAVIAHHKVLVRWHLNIFFPQRMCPLTDVRLIEHNAIHCDCRAIKGNRVSW